jgi:glucoamylase
MPESRAGPDAFGAPGIEPRWTQGAKDGVGTAYSTASRIWFTLFNGTITEVYYPTVDRPQIRDLQFLLSDGESFFHDEKRMPSRTIPYARHGLAYRVISEDPDGRFRLVKEVVTDRYAPCLLQQVRLEGDVDVLRRLRVYVLCAPHLEVCGWHNDARVMEVAGRRILTAHREGRWLAIAATRPFAKLSCGYVGTSDGWTDLRANLRMDWEFERALDGNVALTGEIEEGAATPFTLGLAFGDSLESAATTLFQSLATPFADHRRHYLESWSRYSRKIAPIEGVSGDGGHLYRRSYGLLLAHEDKTFPGALIASLSIPWGEVHGDDDQGGYHLVWTRDMVNSATALMAADHSGTALRALIYLSVAQRADGGFPQNFWIDGRSYWQGIQLDEVAFPILLAWRLTRSGALGDFDPWPMVRRAAAFLVRHGPATEQERWEEASGYSPSTLASNIAALICAADLARMRGEEPLATWLEEYADFLESHVEQWTVTTSGTLLPGVSRHYIRILPIAVTNAQPDENPDRGELRIANRGPGERSRYPAKDIVDAGFLELVRYGIRKPGDALIEDSLRVVDAVLRVEMPAGPCWRRYNHDGYGQRADGGPFDGWGVGRAWPLLTGERGHYELAAGRDPGPFIRAMEGFASGTGMLPEQVWDGAELPARYLAPGGPTGAAMPLMWAHAEYIKLLRSAADGRVFDRVPVVAARYLGHGTARRRIEVWKPNRRVTGVRAGTTLRIQAGAPFRLRWTRDEWMHATDTRSVPTGLGIEYVDLEPGQAGDPPLRFTFCWPDRDAWEGRDYAVGIE